MSDPNNSNENDNSNNYPEQSERGPTVLLDNNARSDHYVTQGHGEIDHETGKGHHTQVYEDNYRRSWEHPNQEDDHWTNQNLPKGHPDRHNPPEDARD